VRTLCQAALNVTGNAALETAQSNLVGLKASLDAERGSLSADLAAAEDKIATLLAEKGEVGLQRDALEAQAAESKGTAFAFSCSRQTLAYLWWTFWGSLLPRHAHPSCPC